jgi:predicted RNase H-like nuclease
MGASERLPYKVSKMRKYWPSRAIRECRVQLRSTWAKIVASLAREIHGVTELLPPLSENPNGKELKAYEDSLDAVVCAWVGMCVMEGRAKPYGDEDSAIWIPTSGRLS